MEEVHGLYVSSLFTLVEISDCDEMVLMIRYVSSGGG